MEHSSFKSEIRLNILVYISFTNSKRNKGGVMVAKPVWEETMTFNLTNNCAISFICRHNNLPYTYLTLITRNALKNATFQLALLAFTRKGSQIHLENLICGEKTVIWNVLYAPPWREKD